MPAKRKLFKKSEALVVVIVLLIAVFGFIFFRIKGNGEKSPTANIYVFSEVYKTVKLDGSIEYEKIIIDGKLEVEIIVSGDEIFFFKSQCPDKVCINAGKLKFSHQSAACLPADISILIN